MRPSRKTLLLAAFLFLLNLWFVKELLRAEFIAYMFSIEGAYIGLARYVAANWRDLTWFPLWYGGIPYQHTYLPLLHLVVAAVSKLLGLAPGLAYHATTAVFYSLGPVTLFLFAKEISKSRAYSFAAALLYSITSPSLLLIPVVRYDAGSVWHARRLQALVFYGEGPHITALMLLPLALLLLALALRKGRAWWVPAALAMAAVAITNWIGATALAVGVAAWLASNAGGNFMKRCLAVAGATVYAYALVCSWIPPSTVLNTRRMEMLLMGRVAETPVRILLAAAIVLGFAGFALLLHRLKTPPELRFSLLFLFPLAGLTLAAEWFRVFLVPQAPRCHLEMEMGIALVTAFGAKLLLERLTPRARVAIACVLLAAAVFPAVKYRRYAKRISRTIDIHRTIEYREAQWFAANMDGRRVFVHGSIGFFLNAFTDVPQFWGGFDQGEVNTTIARFRHQILSGQNAGEREGEVAVLALKAFGVDAVATGGPRSQEAFKPYVNPNKFAGLLPEVWRDGDDVIYRVPRRSPSLAHVIRPGDLPAHEPEHGLDVDPIRAYVGALEDPSLPVAAMLWHNRHEAAVSAVMQRDQVLSVQMSYHPGWSASVKGEPRRLFRDHLGQIAVEPACQGACTVELSYDGGAEMRIARAVSWGSMLGGLLWLLIARRR